MNTFVVLTAGLTKFGLFPSPMPGIIMCGGLGNPGSNPYPPPNICGGAYPSPGAGRTPGNPGGGRIMGLLNPIGAGVPATGEGSFGIGTMPLALGEMPCPPYGEGGNGGRNPGGRVGMGMPGIGG